MLGDFDRIRRLAGAEVLMLPQIAHLGGSRHGKGFEIESHGDGSFGAVKEAYAETSIDERPRPDFQQALFPNAMALNAIRVLITTAMTSSLVSISFVSWFMGAKIIYREERSGKWPTEPGVCDTYVLRRDEENSRLEVTRNVTTSLRRTS
jgi:hypothetical protein